MGVKSKTKLIELANFEAIKAWIVPRMVKPSDFELTDELYQSALLYLFNRDTNKLGQEWFWDDDIYPEGFNASSEEWLKIQTVLFSRIGNDVSQYSDEQIGQGLFYLWFSGCSDVPSAVRDAKAPDVKKFQFVYAMRYLWSDLFAVRFKGVVKPIGSGKNGRLDHMCHMWFDDWCASLFLKDTPGRKEAVLNLLEFVVNLPNRECQISGLHGLGHEKYDLNADKEIETIIDAYLANKNLTDIEMIEYAKQARTGYLL